MERKDFIRTCCISAVGIPLAASMLQGCSSIHYAKASSKNGILQVRKREFTAGLTSEDKQRKFILLNVDFSEFPICLYRTGKDKYAASLLECTHNGCELNVGGGIYTCPCHGAEFSVEGEVLEGPAEENLRTFEVEVDNENIYIQIS
jgi:cytochrome b6-f complex iron-sulfur subunit|tara:strand:- start:5 stop:445 length:441 start_codon:yes stop_codon:yes gene_type:complete